MPSDICSTIKAAMGEVATRQEASNDAGTDLVLGLEMSKLETEWQTHGCNGGVPWAGLKIDPPTQEQINRANELMAKVGQTTLAAMQTDAIAGAVIQVAGHLSGSS